MATFIDRDGGCGKRYLNLDHVTTVRREGGKYLCFDRDGDRISEMIFPPEPAAIVPNNADVVLIRFGPDWYHREPILAWHVEGGHVGPVTTDFFDPDGDEVYCYEQVARGETAYVFPSECRFDDWDKARAYGLSEAAAREREYEARAAKAKGNREVMT